MDIENGKVELSNVKIFDGIMYLKKDKKSLNNSDQMLKLAITPTRLIFFDSKVSDLEIDEIAEKEKDVRFFHVIPIADLRGRPS